MDHSGALSIGVQDLSWTSTFTATKIKFMQLLHLPWNRSRPHSQLGVGWHNEGISLVRVLHTKHAEPVLDLYKSLPYHEISTLRQLSKSHSLKHIPCKGVMELGSYQLLLIETPNVHDTELRAAVRWQVQELINFDIEDAIIDMFEAPPSDRGRREKMIYVVVAHKRDVQTHMDELLNAHLKVATLLIPELALRNIAALLPEDNDGVVLLWLTPGYEMITVTRKATLYLTRTIEEEGNSWQQLMKNDESTEGEMDKLIVEIQRSLNYYENHFNKPPIKHLVIAPMSFPLPNLHDYLATQLRMTVRLLELNELLSTEIYLSTTEQAQCFPILGAALG